MTRWALIVNKTVFQITEDDPSGMFPPDMQWVECGPEVREGWAYTNRSFQPPKTETLDRAAMLREIDAAAEQARHKYITPGAGQALTYLEKAAELDRYDADSQPRISEYPLLGGEIGVTSDSLRGVADAVREAREVWRDKGAAIERTRLKAKADVAKAKDDDAVRAVIDAISWP